MLFRTVIALSFTLSTLIFGAMPSPVYAADPVLVGAGDIGNCGTDSDEATARLLDEISGTVFTTGDNVYPDGTASQFARCYDPNWGRHKERTRPTPGNHDYHTSGASAYFDYFGAAAGRRGEGYYSYDLGAWHIIALNSNISMSAGSAQMEWLQADLQANPADCTLAYWHHPRFSSGDHGSSSMPRAAWETLYEAGADVVLNGHDHNYERFAPQTPSGALDRTRGIRQFVVGTGGTDLRDVGSPIANSEARNDTTHGVLKLTLRATSYDWEFVPVAGRTYEDAGSGSCSGATDAPTRTITPTRNMPTATVPRTATRTPTSAPSETATRTSTATPVETAMGTPTNPPDNTPVPEGCETSSEEWESRSFEPQYGTFTAEFDATPHRPRMDGVTGLAAGSADEYDDLAAIVRFNPDGLIDARDGPAYRAVAPIPYTAGTSYRFRMVVRVPEHTYDIFVTPADGSEQEVGTNFAFRTEQAEVPSLSNWAVYREHGTHTVCDFTIAPMPPATATPNPGGCETSSDDWQSRSFEQQQGTFTAEFDATPHKANMDGVTGLAAGSATEYDDLTAIVRFNPDGFIDARDGSAYRAIAPIPYQVGISYRFRLVVRVPEHTYDIFVTPAGGSEQEVGTNFAFRTEQADVASLGSWAIHREHGTHAVCDFAILPALPATPTPTTEWTNRLRNAGFELDRDESGRPDNWTTNRRATRSDREVHGGSYAMQHSATDDKNYKIRQTVNHVRGEQLYTFAGWVNIPDTDDEFTFELQLSWRAADNEIIETIIIQTYTAPTSGWESITASLVSPAGTARATIRMVIKSLNAAIYVDDFVFVEGAGPLPADGILPPPGADDSGDAFEPDTEDDDPEFEGEPTPTLAARPSRTSPVIAPTPTPQVPAAPPTATTTPTTEASPTGVVTTSTSTAVVSATPEPTPSEMATATPEASPTMTTTPTPTAMVVPTLEPAPTIGVTPTSEATPTAIATSTPQATSTATATWTPEAVTATPTATTTPTTEASPTEVVTTSTPTAMASPIPEPAPSEMATATPEASPTMTTTPTPTAMVVPTPEPAPTVGVTPTSEVPDPTPTSGLLEAAPTANVSPTADATQTEAALPTPEATQTEMVTPTPEILEPTPASELVEPPQLPWPPALQADRE